MLAALLLAAEDELKVLPQTDELVWGSVAFFIVIVVLLKLVFPRLKKGLEARAERIQGQITEAEQTKLEADTILQQYQSQLAEARSEQQRIIDEARKAADGVRRDIEARAQQEAQQIVERARAEVGAERDRALQELRATIGDLSIVLATKVVERELSNPESQRALVQRMIEELAATGPSAGNGGSSGG